MTLVWGLLLAICAAVCYDGAIALQAAEARKVETDDSLHPRLFARLARRSPSTASAGRSSSAPSRSCR
jgi:hypothetical protein